MIILLAHISEISATDEENRMALIIVSTYEMNSAEFSKAGSFHLYLLDDGYQEEDIKHLGMSSGYYSDGLSNVSNVENEFNWLINNEDPDKDIVIYLSDHVPPLSGDEIFRFQDGNISIPQVDTWISDMDFNSSTVIVGGNHSGIAGPELEDPSRDIICSMGSDQSFSLDHFNITRGLEDTSADTNNDGEVSYIEAYWKEVENLQGSDQDPCIWT